jgi:signal transduction histidine kinase
MLLSIIRDVSAKKEMERNLTNVGTLIETRERKKLAADLHDNVGPLLSSMNMYLSVLSRKEELIPYDETLNDIRRILKDAILSIREISNDLSPHILQNFGLNAALEKFFETKKKLIKIQINSNIEGFRFSEIKETMIYRIIIEAFNNTIKHSEADKLSVEIKRENNFIEVVYTDNGIGFNLNEKLNSQNRGLGLFSIINRIKLLEGTYAIETSPGNGFTLRIEFPINN